jgi:hypothetical protein
MSLSVISVLVHAYVAWRLIPALAEFTGLQVGVSLLVLTSAICLQAGLSRWRSRRRDSSQNGEVAMVAAFVAMGFLSSLLVQTLLRNLALATVLLGGQLDLTISISTFAAWSALAVPAAALLMTLWGWINARRTAGVVAASSR